MNGKIKYKVSVRCMTYNQSQYIQDTLNGFCMQKTNFPYVCTIVDDASTDGEQNVINGYVKCNFDINSPEAVIGKDTDYGLITYVPHMTNRNCYFLVILLKENHYQIGRGRERLKYIDEWINSTPYVALCEGDDYWCDPLKLQKQYDLMESHPEYSLCHHDYKILEGSELKSRLVKIPHTHNLLSLAESNPVATPTIFFRNYNEPLIPEKFPFRYHVYLHFTILRLAEYGDVVYIDEPMAVYRVNQGGVFSQQLPRRQYLMTIGNIINMIDWYTVGVKRPDVVEILKKRARRLSIGFIKGSILRFSIHDLVTFFKVYRHFWI